MRSFELVAEGKLTPQVQALDQSARNCVEADIGAAFARRSVGVRLEHNHPVACRVCDVDRPFGIRVVAYDTATKTAMRTPVYGGRDDRHGSWWGWCGWCTAGKFRRTARLVSSSSDVRD